LTTKVCGKGRENLFFYSGLQRGKPKILINLSPFR